MAAYDLIDEARARVALPSAKAAGADDTAIGYLITACSRAIERYCRRKFTSDTYDELYTGTGQIVLALRNYPIQSVQSLRYREQVVMTVKNTSASVQQARVEILSSGIRLVSVASGVKTTTTAGLTFAGNVTLSALATAIAAVSGWTASVISGFTLWPSVDLYCANGSTTDPGTNAGAGALNAAGVNAELRMHTSELSGYQIHNRGGGLYRGNPYTDPEVSDTGDLQWPIGVNNFRIQYTAGYTTVPEDIQEACAQLVAYHFRLGPRETPNIPIPPVIAQYLAPYRKHVV